MRQLTAQSEERERREAVIMHFINFMVNPHTALLMTSLLEFNAIILIAAT